jgi:hypothetical protein
LQETRVVHAYQFRLSSEAAACLEMEVTFTDDSAAMRYAETFYGYQVDVRRDALNIGMARNASPHHSGARRWWFQSSPAPSWLQPPAEFSRAR